MTDYNVMFVCFCAISAVLIFTYNAVYGGKYDSIINSSVGDVFHFEYEQPLNGEVSRHFVQVIEPVQFLNNYQINNLNNNSTYRRYDSNFKRGNHLVMCKMIDGNIRQFYCERITNCRKPMLGRLLFTK